MYRHTYVLLVSVGFVVSTIILKHPLWETCALERLVKHFLNKCALISFDVAIIAMGFEMKIIVCLVCMAVLVSESFNILLCFLKTNLNFFFD